MDGGSAPASTLLGSYYGDEGAGTDRYSTLQIQQSGSGVLCRLSIYRLTAIDAYGSDRGGWLDVAGTDASGRKLPEKDREAPERKKENI